MALALKIICQNNEEIEIWGDVIKKLNPNAKLR